MIVIRSTQSFVCIWVSRKSGKWLEAETLSESLFVLYSSRILSTSRFTSLELVNLPWSHSEFSSDIRSDLHCMYLIIDKLEVRNR